MEKRERTPVTPGDNPIKKPEDDVLGRATVAQDFAEQVLLLDVTEGAVVGVLGAWGSGKTSFVNLARTHWKKNNIPVLDFNPWMFSGTQQLVESFFAELSTQLRLRSDFEEVGKVLEEYGEIFTGLTWVPLVGPWVERGRLVAKIIGKVFKGRKESSHSHRDKVIDALSDLNKRIVVVLDDIDRLTTSEIRDVFKLVRLTANFPNIIYVLAFDQERVAKALNEPSVSGRDYLEKILLYSVDLPVVSKHLLTRQITKVIDHAISRVGDDDLFQKNRLPDVYWEIISPLIKNMRDVRRYAIQVQATLGQLGGKVALIDLLALEAVRLFLHDTFLQIRRSVDVLTSTSDSDSDIQDHSQRRRTQIENLEKSAGKQAEVVRSLVRRLFPAGARHLGVPSPDSSDESEWLKQRRVADEDILRLYLERVANKELQAFYRAEQALALMSDRKAFDTFLRSFEKEQLEDIISSLAHFRDEFAPEQVESGAVVLLNLLPELPERDRGFLDMGNWFFVNRVVYRLLRSLKDPSKVEASIRKILTQITTLSSKLGFIGLVGHHEDGDGNLVPESVARAFEADLRKEVCSAKLADLVKDNNLLALLLFAKGEKEPTPPLIDILNSPEATLAVLRSAYFESRSQDDGSRNVYSHQRLDWERLLKLYGDENTLCELIESLKASPPEDCEELLELAIRYCRGKKPTYRDEYLQSRR